MMKQQKADAIQTENAYLDRLGKRLLRYFPMGQAAEILEDYQEHFSLGRERGGTDADLIATLGIPETVTAAILKEMPEGYSYRLRHTACWGVLSLLAGFLLCLRYTNAGWAFYYNTAQWTGTCILWMISAAALFVLLHGWGQTVIESRFLQASQRPGIAAYILPAAVVLMTEALMQYLLITVENGSLPVPTGAVGSICSAVLNIGSLVTGLTAIWGLWRSYGVSIRFFPISVHAVGALLFIRELEQVLHSMDVSVEISTASFGDLLVWPTLLPYCFGICLALLFWYGMRSKMQDEGRRQGHGRAVKKGRS